MPCTCYDDGVMPVLDPDCPDHGSFRRPANFGGCTCWDDGVMCVLHARCPVHRPEAPPDAAPAYGPP